MAVESVPNNASFDPQAPVDVSGLHLVARTPQADRRVGQLVTRSAERLVFPESNDWERYREIIQDLYMKRNMSLAQVKTEMEEHHKFKAT